MPELFIELFSEEIPARMQAAGAETLKTLLTALQDLLPRDVRGFYGPRRIAIIADVQPAVLPVTSEQRGPRKDAPERAIDGFLRKFGLTRENLAEPDPLARVEDGYWVVRTETEGTTAAVRIAKELPDILRRFPWPKSMRWGGTSNFTWVRPLRRIVCLLDGAVVPFDLRDGADDGHGLASGNLTEGHRFHAPTAFAVNSAANWQEQLTARRVLVDAADRKRIIADRIAGLAAEKQLSVVDDPGLLDEVAGLVEWPVPHLGRIADEHMDLPPEVMQVSMRVNQRYFALRTANGDAAAWFAFVANIEADDHGAAIIAGNERVLRARFSDARHFWDLDRKVRLESRVPALDKVVFQAKLGTQGDRVRRLQALAARIAEQLGADPAQAARAAELAKADLLTGMVGEFPELQGVMGRYYALHDGEATPVADAIRDHYAPRGPGEAAPSAPVSIAVALADKLDQLTGFFAIGEKPTGSGDPYALRRAALGVIRIIRENKLRVALLDLCEAALPALSDSMRRQRLRDREAGEDFHASGQGLRTVPGTSRQVNQTAIEVVEFIQERLKIQLRSEGLRHDVLEAVLSANWDDELLRTLSRADAVADFLNSPDGANLLAGYRRAANILRIEDRKDGPHRDAPNLDWLRSDEEQRLRAAAVAMADGAARTLEREDYRGAMVYMAGIREPLDVFFEKVTVNAPDPDLRRNRLRLLNQVRSTMDQIADFSRIEG